MALVDLSYCLARNQPQSTREVASRVCESSEVPVSCSRLNFVSFKSSRAVCHCSVSSYVCTSGRESAAGGNFVADWGQQGQGDSSGRRACEPIKAIKISRESTEDNTEEEEENDTELCPVECVREFKSRSEFDEILQYGKEQKALVVVDFFKTACGSCRYIEKGFTKLCKGAGNTDVSVIFLKHNVMDEYEEQSEVAETFKIKVVPLFHFYKDGELVESFPTREKTKILAAICKHTGLDLEDVDIPRRN